MVEMPNGLEGADVWLVESLVVPASLHDANGQFVYMNAPAERASGKSNAEMAGSSYLDLLPLEARANVEAQFRRAIEQGEPTDFVTVFVDASGQTRGTRAQHLPLRRGGVIVGVMILAFDVRQPLSGLSAVDLNPQLTPRQREILDLIASGLSTSEIAKEL